MSPDAPALPTNIVYSAELIKPLAVQDQDCSSSEQTRPDLTPDPDVLTKEMFLELMKDFKDPLFADDALKNIFKPP